MIKALTRHFVAVSALVPVPGTFQGHFDRCLLSDRAEVLGG